MENKKGFPVEIWCIKEQEILKYTDKEDTWNWELITRMWSKPSSSRLLCWPTSFWPKTTALNNNNEKLCSLGRNEAFDHFTPLPILPGKLLKRERSESNKRIDFTQVPFFQEHPPPPLLLLLPLLANSPKPWIIQSSFCASCSFFSPSPIHIYAGLIHTTGWKLNPPQKSRFQKPLLYLCLQARFGFTGLSFFFFASDCSSFFSPLQLAGQHVNVVKKKKKSGTVWPPVVKKGKRKQRVTQALPTHFDGRWRLLISHHQHSFAWKPFFHSSQFCRFSSFTIKASTLSFQFLPVWIHSPLLFFSLPPCQSLHTPLTLLPRCASTPSAVSSTLSGLAGEQRQAAGGGLGSARVCCHPTGPLAPQWGSLQRLSVDTLFREDNGEDGQEGPECPLCGYHHSRVRESLTIWTAWIVVRSLSHKQQTDFTVPI